MLLMIPNLSGKSGGYTGIDYGTTRELAIHGAHMFVASHNEEHINSAIEKN
ncbi:hypothetical protein C2G38_2172267 [Gigaspora rosea]|uniref:Uncharacterized protein n=1 Tax=Gigaspora rosea TaxID=44941 RepID=A0A397VQ02_9GLOM|nr:hypothetical protein C2G38_2172267 [Gigaspora rosea]CAG8493822.1 12171_t:CDS:2 [Gigaspora rosea]